MATQIEIQNNIHLERLLTTHPDMEKKVRKIVRQVLKGAEGAVEAGAKGMSTKQAYLAVRKSVYKKLLGGNINILDNHRRAGQKASIPAAVRGRSRRTEDLMSYQGADRGFILRFLNSGTDMRTVENLNNHPIRLAQRPEGKRTYRGGIGNRGRIAARNWFEPLATKELNNAAEQFDLLLDALIKKEFS